MRVRSSKFGVELTFYFSITFEGRFPYRRPWRRLLRCQPSQVVLRSQGHRHSMGSSKAPRHDQAPGGQPLLQQVL